MRCRIELDPFELSLNIGCTPQERDQPQPIGVHFWIESTKPFKASTTDVLQDTLDASLVKDTLIRALKVSHSSTLEHLADQAQRALVGLSKSGFGELAWHLKLSKPKWGWSYVHSWST